MDTIRLAFVDDQRLFRNGFARIIQNFKGIDLQIIAENGLDLLAQIKAKGTPDVVLIDLEMPGLDGTKVGKLLREQYPKVKTIILTGHDNNELIVRLLQDGFNAYLHKDAQESEVEEAIRQVANTGHYASFRAIEASRAVQLLPPNAKKYAPKDDALTAGEIDIIKLICKGLKDSEISEKLCKSLRTIQNQKLMLRRKIGAHSTADIISYAIKNNLAAGTAYLNLETTIKPEK